MKAEKKTKNKGQHIKQPETNTRRRDNKTKTEVDTKESEARTKQRNMLELKQLRRHEKIQQKQPYKSSMNKQTQIKILLISIFAIVFHSKHGSPHEKAVCMFSKSTSNLLAGFVNKEIQH